MSYADEYQSTLQRIYADNSGVRSLIYFIEVAARWHARYVDIPDGASAGTPAVSVSTQPRVVILGHGVPEELIHACGVTPYYLLGGGHASCSWSDHLVPRDSDPVSRSILGYATRLVNQTGVDPLFVIPLANDNLRKIAYLLKREGHTVCPVDIPPEVASVSAQRAWERSLTNMVAAVEHHVGRHATARSIRRADELVGAARFAMIDLRQAVAQRTGVLSDEAVLFLLGTYYQTDDLPRWIAMMRQLVDEVRTSHHAPEQLSDGRPRVLVIGSPILFPQYKVPALIHEAGLALVEAVDASSTARFSSLTPEERRGGVARLIETIARKHYVLDASGARAVNQPMEQYLSYLLQATGVEGIVCHVLKGHIEHDFELARLERFLDQLDIPVLRLETDYQYQDVEQLRIRLEAFAETLEQRAFVASRSSRLRCA